MIVAAPINTALVTSPPVTPTPITITPVTTGHAGTLNSTLRGVVLIPIDSQSYRLA